MARRNYGKLEPEKPREYSDHFVYPDGSEDKVEYYQGSDDGHAIVVTNPDTAPCFYVFRRANPGEIPARWELDHESVVEPHDVAECKRRRELIRDHFALYRSSESSAWGMLACAAHEMFDMQRKPSDKPAYDYQPAPIVKEPVERVRSSKTRFFGVSFRL